MSEVVIAAIAMAAAVWIIMPPSEKRLHAVAARNAIRSEPTAPAPVSALDHLRRRLQRRQLQAAARRRVIDALAALAAELRSGQLPASALINATTRPPVWPHAVAAAAQHGDVAAGLDEDARSQPLLRALAACWRLAEHAGSGLADATDQLAASARADERVRGELEAQLAAPRASARMLALLPLFGIGLGIVMGADPLGWLFGSPLGVLAMSVGAGLAAAGFWWTAGIVANVEKQL